MLPIDTLSEKAEEVFRSNGTEPAELYAAVRLDQDPDGAACECYLAIDGSHSLLFRVILKEGAERFEALPLADYSEAYIDSFLSACQLLAKRKNADGSACTVSLGCGTNSCKTRLFTFLSVWETLDRGDVMTGEEQLFETLRKSRVRPKADSSLLRRALAYFAPYKKTLILIFFFLMVEIGSDLIRPYLSGKIMFDEIISETGRWHSLEALVLCVLAIIGLALARWGVIIARNYVNAHMSQRVVEKMRNQLFDSMQKQSMAYFNRNSVGRLITNIGWDVANVSSFFTSDSISLVIYLLDFLVVCIVLFVLNWKLSMLIILPIPILVYIYRKVFPSMRRLSMRSNRENAAVSSRINDSLDGIRVVKSFSKEREESAMLAERLKRLYRVNLQSNLLYALLGPTIALLIYLANQAIWGLGGLYVMGERLTYGDFCTYLGFVGMVFAPIQFFSNFTTRVGQASESAEHMAALLDAVPDVQEAEVPAPLTDLRGNITFSNVNFHYLPNRPILKNLSFRVNAGDHIGIVGHTGSGKSTIANLITRMYDATGGRIEIDGVDIRQLPLDALRRNIVIVSQEIHLFIGSVADNIRFGKPEATMEEVIAAATAAGAHDFILSLPNGYETAVGIGGHMLSGGERQRISIARALLLRPNILILDEATAAMDNETEQRISTAIAGLIRGKTTLSIAHRLSSLRDCNKIMAIEGGEVREMGSREELLAKKGIFYKLFTLQNEQMLRVVNGEEETI